MTALEYLTGFERLRPAHFIFYHMVNECLAL